MSLAPASALSLNVMAPPSFEIIALTNSPVVQVAVAASLGLKNVTFKSSVNVGDIAAFVSTPIMPAFNLISTGSFPSIFG